MLPLLVEYGNFANLIHDLTCRCRVFRVLLRSSSRPPRLWFSLRFSQRSERRPRLFFVPLFVDQERAFFYRNFFPRVFGPALASSTTLSACGLDHKQQGAHRVQTRPRRWAKSTNTHSAENPAYTWTVPRRPCPSFFAGTPRNPCTNLP